MYPFKKGIRRFPWNEISNAIAAGESGAVLTPVIVMP